MRHGYVEIPGPVPSFELRAVADPFHRPDDLAALLASMGYAVAGELRPYYRPPCLSCLAGSRGHYLLDSDPRPGSVPPLSRIVRLSHGPASLRELRLAPAGGESAVLVLASCTTQKDVVHLLTARLNHQLKKLLRFP